MGGRLFSSPLPESAAQLERAVNVARAVGAVLAAASIVTGQVATPFALALAAVLAAQSAFVAWHLRRALPLSARVAAAFSAGDILAVSLSLFEIPPGEAWVTAAAPILAIIVVTLRSGRGGALFAASASTIALVAAAAYRGTGADLGVPVTTLAAWATLYLLAALLMSGAVRELAILRDRQRLQLERDAALLGAQSDLGEMLIVSDGDRVLEANAAVARVIGRDAAAGGVPISELFLPEDAARIHAQARLRGSDRFEAGMRAVDGHRIDVDVAVTAVERDSGRLILVARDISERKRIERQLERRALYDPLTGLPNRVLLHDRVDQAIAAVDRGGPPVAVLLLDIVHFRDVNDSLGFAVGDALLAEVAAGLRGSVQAADTVARIGGDEFAVVLTGGSDAIARSLDTMAAVARRSVTIDGTDVAVDVSIGLASHPQHGADADTLLRHAEFAMYEAKASGRRVVTYAPGHGVGAPSQIVMADMRRAIEEGELVLFYQPQVQMATRQLFGFEALVRWQHPRLGLIPPSEFVPLVERSAVCRAFTDHVLLQALRDRATLPDGLRELPLAINVSGRDLIDPGLAASVRLLVGETGMRALTFEVTERVLLDEPVVVRQNLRALGDLGIHSSIDDFGTGGSSLSHLVHLPVSELKIDGSFVTGLATDPKRRAVVRSTIDLAHALGSHVIAEGIEDEGTWSLLCEMGCDTGQGYYLARPMPLDELVAWARREGFIPAAV